MMRIIIPTLLISSVLLFHSVETSSRASSSSGGSGRVPPPENPPPAEIVLPSPYGLVGPFNQDIVFNRMILARGDFINHIVTARPNHGGFEVYHASDLQPTTISYSDWGNAMHGYALNYEMPWVQIQAETYWRDHPQRLRRLREIRMRNEREAREQQQDKHQRRL